MTYEAVYMPANSDYDPSKGGFKTRDEAWEFIYSKSCDDCKNSAIDRCSSEWIVLEETRKYKFNRWRWNLYYKCFPIRNK